MISTPAATEAHHHGGHYSCGLMGSSQWVTNA